MLSYMKRSLSRLRSVVALSGILAMSSCMSSNSGGALGASGVANASFRDDVAIARPPYHSVATEWKERLDQPYVFLELVGPYSDTGRFLGELRSHLEAQGLRASGAPFALFYDDPLRVAPENCRSRLCVPVETQVAVGAPLGFAVLPGVRVVYALVSGPYNSVSAAYPAMFDVLRTRNWVLDGPIREIYLVDPTRVASFDELVTEIQMPWRPL
jgi:AraC family transcriptional regulator